MSRRLAFRRAALAMTTASALATSVGLLTGPVPVLAATPAVLAADSFTRTLSNSWGSADVGGPWSVASTTMDFGVGGGLGTMLLPGAQATRRALLGDVAARDVTVTARVEVNRLAAVNGGGSGQYASFVVRHQASGSEYRAHVRFGPTGGVFLGASATSNSALPGETALAPEIRVPQQSAAANSFFRLRLRVTGANPTTLRLRAWRGGTPEPSTWAYTATNSHAGLQQAGSLGLMAYVSLPLANAPLTFNFDNLRAIDATSSGGDWAQFQHDPRHSGSNAAETILSPLTVGGLAPAWTGNTGSDVAASPPVVAEGVVYVGGSQLNAFAVGCGTGGTTCSPLWTGITGTVYTAPAVADGVVYVDAASGGKLSAFAVGCGTGGATCTPLWTGSTGDVAPSFGSSPAVSHGVVYVGGSDGRLYAFAVDCGSGGATCSALWTAEVGGISASNSSPAVADGAVYIGSWNGRVYAFAVGCGSGGAVCLPLWTGLTGGSINSSPNVTGGVVYVGSSDGKLYAFKAGCGSGGATCAPLWTGAAGDSIGGSPAVADLVVYVGSLDGKLYAFAVDCGSAGAACSPLWTGATGNMILSSPAVANGVVYIGGGDDCTPSCQGKASPQLTAFAVGCGSAGAACAPLWTGGDTHNTPSSPAVSHGVVYIGSWGNGLSAFALPGH